MSKSQRFDDENTTSKQFKTRKQFEQEQDQFDEDDLNDVGLTANELARLRRHSRKG